MSLPTGAITMLDISTGYGRGAAGVTGFQNYYPYALGEYYRGGQYVPYYDNSSPNGTRATSQSNVDMNTLRGSGGYTHYSTVTAASDNGKFPTIGYVTASGLGSINDRTFKCYSNSNIVSGIYTQLGTIYLRLDYAAGNNGWYSIQIINNNTGSNYTYFRTAATFAVVTTNVVHWYWTTSEAMTAGYTYNIRVRLTSTY